jgi:hypothetical protein
VGGRDSVLQAEFKDEYVQLAGIINELLQQHRLVMGTDASGASQYYQNVFSFDMVFLFIPTNQPSGNQFYELVDVNKAEKFRELSEQHMMVIFS